jgi:hypothetical protein
MAWLPIHDEMFCKNTARGVARWGGGGGAVRCRVWQERIRSPAPYPPLRCTLSLERPAQAGCAAHDLRMLRPQSYSSYLEPGVKLRADGWTGAACDVLGSQDV